MKSPALALVMLGAASASAAPLNQATAGYTYFNRPGSDMAAHDSALRECLGYAAQAHLVGSLSPGPSVLGAEIESAQKNNVFAANVENCMVVMGWRVVRLPPSEGQALAALDQAALAQRLGAWTGATNPEGEIARVWENDAVLGSTNRIGHAHVLGDGAKSLSLVALKPGEAVSSATAAPRLPAQPKTARGLVHPLSVQALDQVPSDSALVILDVRNAGMTYASGFIRQGPDLQTPAWTVDGRPAAIAMMNQDATLSSPGGARLLAFAAPPGRWQLMGMAGVYSALSFCLGAPAFDVAAGDVIFAGRFDFTGPGFGPDLALDDARAMLASHPDLAAKLKPARYVNGTRLACDTFQNIYAFEVKGAPFVAGYTWGGAAQAGGR